MVNTWNHGFGFRAKYGVGTRSTCNADSLELRNIRPVSSCVTPHSPRERVLRLSHLPSFKRSEKSTLDPAESDPTRLAPDRLAALKSGGGASAGAKAPRRRVELWHALGLALLSLLLVEGVLSIRRT